MCAGHTWETVANNVIRWGTDMQSFISGAEWSSHLLQHRHSREEHGLEVFRDWPPTTLSNDWPAAMISFCITLFKSAPHPSQGSSSQVAKHMSGLCCCIGSDKLQHSSHVRKEPLELSLEEGHEGAGAKRQLPQMWIRYKICIFPLLFVYGLKKQDIQWQWVVKVMVHVFLKSAMCF